MKHINSFRLLELTKSGFTLTVRDAAIYIYNFINPKLVIICFILVEMCLIAIFNSKAGHMLLLHLSIVTKTSKMWINTYVQRT